MDKNCNKKNFFVYFLVIIAGFFIISTVFLYNSRNNYINKLENSYISIIKSNAVIAILNNSDELLSDNIEGWYVNASVTESGTVTIISIEETEKIVSSDKGILSKDNVTGTYRLNQLVITRDDLENHI